MPLVMPDADDSDVLLESARAGSREALGALYRRHADDVFTTAYRITGSREDAEDVTQDVFLGLPRALSAYREQGRFPGWLQRVTARTALMWLRSMRRKGEESLDDRTVSLRASSPLRRIGAADAVARLPEKLRLVFVLKEIEGYSHAEIAELLGISRSASGVRLSRAWTRLRKELG